MAKKVTATTSEVKLQNLKKTMFISVAVAAIAVSLAMVFSKFLFDLWVYNNNVQSAQRDARQTLQTNIDVYEDLRAGYIALESASGSPESPDADIVLQALPPNYDFPALASSVQLLVDGSNVELANFSGVDEEGSTPGSSYSPDPYEIFFQLEVAGSYEDIQVFINTLDVSIRPFKVIQLELSGSDDSLTANIQLSTYFQPAHNLNYPERTVQ